VITAPVRKTRSYLRGRHTWALQRLPRSVLPSEWVDRPPDFVGVGAQRAGTTWWYAAIQAHPQVHRVLGAPKERHFFDRFHEERFSGESVRSYHRLFARPPGAVSGEWTPRYMYDHWAPRLLERAAPDAKLLVLLRDPVDRYRSAASSREMRKRRSIRAANQAFERGLYFVQLSRLLDHFDRERILVLQYERCRDDPEAELRKTYEFLGLTDTDHVPSPLYRRINATRAEKVTLDAELLASLRAGYRADASVLVEEFPEIDPLLWRSLAL
jgi:sulfotransferase family protein